jgi:hypothetical protein
MSNFPPTLVLSSTTQMIANSQMTVRADWDATQLLNVVNSPLEPGQTLNAFRAFTSSKNFVQVVQGLHGEEAAKLVDMLDQVRRGGLRDALTRLTMAVMTRLSDPSIGRKLRMRRCYGHSAISVAPRLNSHTR